MERKGCEKIGEVGDKEILVCSGGEGSKHTKMIKYLEEVKRIINQAQFDLSDVAQTYIGALEDSYSLYGEKGIRTQILYIVNNLIAKNQQQKLAIKQLTALGEGKPIPSELPKEIPNEMTEIELGQISDSFEEWSAPLLEKDERLELDDFKKYAKDYGYSLDKVLVAQGWIDDCLSNEVLGAIINAKKRVKVLWM